MMAEDESVVEVLLENGKSQRKEDPKI